MFLLPYNLSNKGSKYGMLLTFYRTKFELLLVKTPSGPGLPGRLELSGRSCGFSFSFYYSCVLS